MKTVYTLALIIITSSIFFTSCMSSLKAVENAKVKVEKAQNNLEIAVNKRTEEFNQFVKESNQKIIINNQLINDLKTTTKNMQTSVENKYKKTIIELGEQNLDLNRRIVNYKDDGYKKWKSFNNEFERDMKELSKALKSLTRNNIK